jgi:gluconolactonase
LSVTYRRAGTGWIRCLDRALDRLVSPAAPIEKIANGFLFTEGPVWSRPSRCLYFSDIPGNALLKWTPDGKVTIVRKPVFPGSYTPGFGIGPNGHTLDQEGRLISCEHGNRRLARTEQDGSITVLADRYEGRRLNSPNDVVVKSNGDIYFTDPPYGLPGHDASPHKELSFNGVFRLTPAGRLDLLVSNLRRPNGLAFSPDERKFYVANSEHARRIWMVYDARPDGAVADGRVFFDANRHPARGVPDGMKLDVLGNLYCTGPGGILVLSPAGRHLGTIVTPELPANCHWGDEDGRMLYVTARTGLYRIRLRVPGIRP